MKPFVVLSCTRGEFPTVSPTQFVWQTYYRYVIVYLRILSDMPNKFEMGSGSPRGFGITFANQNRWISFCEKFVLHINKVLTSIF
jgi:hypothetical protein